MNRAKNPIWEQMRSKLESILGGTIELVFPKEWSEQYFSWFREIEQTAFRSELTYNTDEILERLASPDLLIMFILLNEKPQALLLGYSQDVTNVEAFYLDTIAVKQRGRGVGQVMLLSLFEWARKMGYRRIELDTEAENETGHHLSAFYEKLGFVVTAEDIETGNISMCLTL